MWIADGGGPARTAIGRTRLALALLCVTTASQVVATEMHAPHEATAAAEVQVAVCAPADRIVQALALQPRTARVAVWQFDDAALTLFHRGVRLRLRVLPSGRSDFTLKVADQDCAQIDSHLVATGQAKCEYDVYGSRQAGALSITRRLNPSKTTDLLAGHTSPAQALAAAQ